MAKRKPQRRKKPSKKTYKISTVNKFLALLLFSLLITLAAYFILLKNHNDKVNESTKIQKEKIKHADENNIDKIIEEYKKTTKNTTADKYEEFNKEFENEYIHPIEPQKDESNLKEKNEEIQSVEKKVFPENKQTLEKQTAQQKPLLPALEEETMHKEVEKKKEKVVSKTSNKPKLSIVIDDVTLQSQINHIKDIGYIVNISLMPPTKGHKNSARIAQNLPFAIVHFPLQAGTTSIRFEEDNTLKVGDSYKKIEKRVAQIRKWYPKIKYTNNHTGSVFTSDKTSMEYLIKALKKYNFQFIDSRTTAHSVVKEVSKEFGVPYIARNIFLDNNKDFKYIQNQLKKAIRIAKKTGSAIAIGHPYPITMEVLKKSKYLLKDLDLVYINKLPVR